MTNPDIPLNLIDLEVAVEIARQENSEFISIDNLDLTGGEDE